MMTERKKKRKNTAVGVAGGCGREGDRWGVGRQMRRSGSGAEPKF